MLEWHVYYKSLEVSACTITISLIPDSCVSRERGSLVHIVHSPRISWSLRYTIELWELLDTSKRYLSCIYILVIF